MPFIPIWSRLGSDYPNLTLGEALPDEDPLDTWDRLAVHFYSASIYDDDGVQGRVLGLEHLNVQPAQNLSAQPTYFVDLRYHLPYDYFMDAAGLSNLHDGRHHRAQRQAFIWLFIDKMWDVVLQLVNEMALAVRRQRRHLFVRLRSLRGRHRSVAFMCCLAKLFGLVVGVRVDCYMGDWPNPHHQTCRCHCQACDWDAAWLPDPADLHRLRERILAYVVFNMHCEPYESTWTGWEALHSLID